MRAARTASGRQPALPMLMVLLVLGLAPVASAEDADQPLTLTYEVGDILDAIMRTHERDPFWRPGEHHRIHTYLCFPDVELAFTREQALQDLGAMFAMQARYAVSPDLPWPEMATEADRVVLEAPAAGHAHVHHLVEELGGARPAADLPEAEALERRVEQHEAVLRARVDIDWDQTPLEQAFADLAEQIGFLMEVDWERTALAEGVRQAPVSVTLEDEPVGAVLPRLFAVIQRENERPWAPDEARDHLAVDANAIARTTWLGEGELRKYYVVDADAVRIGSDWEWRHRSVPAVYDVDDLLTWEAFPAEPPRREYRVQVLTSLVTDWLAWDDASDGFVAEYDGHLVVQATSGIHWAIDQLLREMRQGWPAGRAAVELDRKLLDPVQVDWEETPLEAVVDDLGEWLDVAVEVDWPMLRMYEIQPDTPVALSAEDVPVGDVLHELLFSLEPSRNRPSVDYVLAEGVLRIGDRRLARTVNAPRAFWVGDLLDHPTFADRDMATGQRLVAIQSHAEAAAGDADLFGWPRPQIHDGYLVTADAGLVTWQIRRALRDLRQP